MMTAILFLINVIILLSLPFKKESEIKDVLMAMWSELKNGHQIYVISPLIEDDNDTELNDIKTLENM